MLFFFSNSLPTLNKSSNCPSPYVYTKCFKTERISPAHTHIFPCQQIEPTENCTRSLDKLSVEFLKLVVSTERSKELQKPTFFLRNTNFQGHTVRSKRAEGSRCFYSTVQETPPSNQHVCTAPATNCSLQQLNLDTVQNTKPHTKKPLHNYVLAKAQADFRKEKTTNKHALVAHLPCHGHIPHCSKLP